MGGRIPAYITGRGNMEGAWQTCTQEGTRGSANMEGAAYEGALNRGYPEGASGGRTSNRGAHGGGKHGGRGL